jgi:hypothetical protein
MSSTHWAVPSESADEAHALLSASSAHRWAVCPASLSGTEEDKASKAAAEGTCGHYIAELILRGLPAPAVGDTIEADGFTFAVDDAMMADIQAYVEFVTTRPWRGGFRVEAQVNYSRYLGVPRNTAWGTADASGIEENPSAPSAVMVHVADLKMGRRPVAPEGNTQLACYAAGVLADMAGTFGPLPAATWVKMTISQPRLSHRPFSWMTTVAWVEEEMLRIRPAAEAGIAFAAGRATAAQQAEFPETPGGHCQYCPRSLKCEARKDEALRAGQAAAAKVPFDPALFRQRESIRDYLVQMEDLARMKALEGQPLPGTKLVQGRAGHGALLLTHEELRKFAQPLGVLDRLVRTEEVWATPAQVRDVLKSVNVPPETLATVFRPGAKPLVITDADDPRPPAGASGTSQFMQGINPRPAGI